MYPKYNNQCNQSQVFFKITGKISVTGGITVTIEERFKGIYIRIFSILV